MGSFYIRIWLKFLNKLIGFHRKYDSNRFYWNYIVCIYGYISLLNRFNLKSKFNNRYWKNIYIGYKAIFTFILLVFDRIIGKLIIKKF